MGPTTGAAIAAHPDIDKIAFTGECRYGQDHHERRRRATSSASRFELGGKSPNVVFADADLDAAVEGRTSRLSSTSGQCCCAGSRLFVEEKIHEEFVERLAKKAKARKIGDPLDPETEQGPQVSEEQ